MTTTIINDCRDGNAAGRQLARVATLLDGPVNFIGVGNDLEAAGNLVDVLDAVGNEPNIILVNVAPRNGKAKKWKNGAPFCYFWYKETLVLASIDGFTLSLVKKLGIVSEVNLLDIPEALGEINKHNKDIASLKEKIATSQFRSFDFLPYAAKHLSEHKSVVNTKLSIAEILDTPNAVWWIDSFGNCKTTMIAPDDDRSHIDTKFGPLPYYKQLKSVPDNELAITRGSSGIEDKRFLEIVVQGGNAANRLSVSTGDRIN